MANCNCNHKCEADTTVRGCFSTGCVNNKFSAANCQCTPCSAPVVVDTDPNLSNEVLVPVLANVIQNCMTIDKYETACPDNLVFLTNFPVYPGSKTPSGTVCIKGISYSYDCIGIDVPGTSKTITGYLDGNVLPLTATKAACSCGYEWGWGPMGPVELYNEFEGSARTTACCCTQTNPPTSRAYALRKICETKLKFAVCNLKVTIQGTIGGYPFTADLKGTAEKKYGMYKFTPLGNPTSLGTLSFPETLNFAGRMCLPTCTKLNISEQFENCLTIDCIRPISATYTNIPWLQAPWQAPAQGAAQESKTETEVAPEAKTEVAPEAKTTAAPESETTLGYPQPLYGYYLLAAGDLSLIINKQIFATTTEKIAVLTTEGASVVCNNGAATTPTCPQTSPCANTTIPCPPAPQMPE